MLLNVGGSFGFLGAADFADHADDVGVGVGLEPLQDVAERRAVDRVAADADGGGDANATVLQLLGGLVPQGARAADDADVALQVDVARHDPQKRLAGADGARAVRARQDHAAFAGVAHHVALHADHVLGRDTVGDADAVADAPVGGFHDRVGGKGRRHEDEGGVAAGCGDGFLHRVEDGDAHDGLPPFAGDDASDDLRAVVEHFLGMELRHAAGDALHDDAAGTV